MPQAGVSTRARRQDAAPWWEELDREAFRFPATYEVEPVRRTVPVAVAPPAGGTESTGPGRTASTGPAAPRAGSPPPTFADAGRRTVVIRGRGAERNLPVSRPTMRRHERPGFKADRAALWAVMLGLLLILVAATSAHAAILH
jgi:hypothetical protein